MEDINIKKDNIETSKIDIIYFAENILNLDLCQYEKQILRKLADLSDHGEKLYYIPSRHRPDISAIMNEFNLYKNSMNEKKTLDTRIKLKHDKSEYWFCDESPVPHTACHAYDIIK